MNLKNFFNVKKYIIDLPSDELETKLYGYFIVVFFLSILVGLFHPDYLNIVKLGFTSWPPEINMVNIDTLATTFFLLILDLLFYFVAVLALSFLISKLFLLFRKKISTKKIWNIIFYALVLGSLLGVLIIAISIPLAYIYMFIKSTSSQEILNLYDSITLFFVGVLVLIEQIGIKLGLSIYGLFISLKNNSDINK